MSAAKTVLVVSNTDDASRPTRDSMNILELHCDCARQELFMVAREVVCCRFAPALNRDSDHCS